MGHFVNREPVRIQLEGSEEWIAIKPKLSVVERGQLMDAIMETGPGKFDQESVDFRFYVGRLNAFLLKLAIVDWHLLDEQGQPVPFSKGRIDDLDQDDPLVDSVLGEIAARNPFGTRATKTG